MMLKCKEAAVLISQDMDRDIAFRDLLKLRVHLVICGVCRRLKTQLMVQSEAAEMANEQDSLPEDEENVEVDLKPDQIERVLQ